MRIEGIKIEATFEKRLNRFVAAVKIGSRSHKVHVPNSGRLAELLVPGARVILREAQNPARKYPYDLIMVYTGDTLVSVDSSLPARLLLSELSRERILNLNYDFVKPEVKYGNSRFDIGLGSKGKIFYYIEVKGVTLVENGRAMFPDAPTERGTKHMLELIRAKEEGYGAGVFFIVQREDADRFSPNDSMDKKFGDAVRKAAEAGVEVFAYNCRVDRNEILLFNRLPVEL
ncbi:DNA/RNA nuclease SfsA [Thermosediminibacter oceani]|uniref:Sugar fermentation stimulation protein homolog n=1 Tax=Thermosediminibacter oceani (strain ATCC BAA-1034 / DSM 16646 / JW/IW-1228P) TaxID=555079 RepID=D9RY07_THEOJ|nr:DNA/RNA nuclease SfsA [Thermosediminibacter oceani]ADL08231.1 sugar fermentation stimulation protein [Thermosediminibacter oceani DSM 16646]